MNSDLTVREIMDREYVGVSESDGLVETVALLLEEDKENAVVLHGSEHVGVLTERDVLSSLVEGPDPADATVGEVMSDHVPTVSPDETASAAADQLSTQSSRRLLVTDGSEPLGVVTEQDLLAGRSYSPEQAEAAVEHTDAVSGASSTMSAEAGTTVTRTESDAGGFDDQGICEVCGSLAGDLSAFNGQLRCAECRDM